MDEEDREEIIALENEYRWVLKHEVSGVIEELKQIVRETVLRFPGAQCGHHKASDTERFVLNPPSTTPPEQVKVVVSVCGDSITHADINLKLPRLGKDLYANTTVRDDSPWRLQQVQDAANHIQQASAELVAIDKQHHFRSAGEIDSFLVEILSRLGRARAAFVSPRKRTLDELQNSRQMKNLSPALPAEIALSFYVQGPKLVMAVYHTLVDAKGASRFQRYQADCVVPWIQDVVLWTSLAMQRAQQLRDKVNVFSQYQDLDVAAAHSQYPS